MVTKKQTKNTETNAPSIKVGKNGPYVVSGGIPLNEQIIGIDTEGYSYEWGDDFLDNHSKEVYRFQTYRFMITN